MAPASFAIVDPGGDPLKTERRRGEALAPVVDEMTRFKLFPFFPDNMGITSIAHLPLMLPRDKIVELSLARNQELLSVRAWSSSTACASSTSTPTESAISRRWRG